MCGGNGECWRAIIECFINSVRAFITWVIRIFTRRNEQGDNSVVAEDSDSQASQSTEIVDPLKEGTSYCSSQSICQTSIKATSAKSLNVIEKVITGSGKQKQKGSSKLSLKTFVPPEATFSQRSKSDSSINTSKLQNQKKNKSEQVDLQSEEEPGPSFTLVKNKRNKKSSSEVPITEETSAENTDLKVVQLLFGASKKNNSPSIPEFSKSNESITAVPFKKCVQFEEVKESKKVDSNRTYAQVTSSLPSTHTETHFIEAERSHQDQITSSPSLIHTERSFTETERSHQDQVTSSSSLTQTERNFETGNFHLAPNPGSWGKQYFDSSEETSGSPFAIVDIADVHREDTLTESENSESNILRTDPQLEGTLSDDLKAIEDLDQVTLSSSLIHKERNLNETENLQLSKNPVTWKKQYFDSSDETSGSPFVIVDIADVHTENTLTEFENSASNILRTDPQPEGTLSDDLKAIEDLDQVTLSSSLIHSERNLPETGNLQLLKDPVTQKKQYFESSEGTSGSPFAIVEEVQRENILTESENSENTDLQFDGTISDDSKGLTDLVDSEKEKTKEELVNKETTVECTDEFKSEDRELDQKQEILIPVKESNEEVDEQSKQDLEEENKENIEEDNNKEDLKEENIHNKQDSDEENNKQGSSNQTKEESQEEVLAKLWKLSPKFSEKHPSQIKTQLVEYQGGKSISFGTIVESDANSVKVQTELKSEAATSSPTSSKSTSDIQISWSSEEAHTRLYENNTAARLQAQLLEHQDTQNTYSDIPSDILDCDSIKIDESEVATLEKEISETESLQQLLEQPFSESESLKDYSLNIDIDELAGEGSLPVEVNSSEFREIEYSATREENQGLLTEQEVSEEIVSEEIQEEEKIIQGIPEVENESSVLKEQNTKSFQWSTEKFKQEADENCTSTHPIVNDLNKLNNIDIIDINHSDFKNMPVKNLKNICKNENEKTNHDTQVRVLTLGDLEFGESTLYRVEKNWVVQFRIGPTLFGRKISLYCNFPGEENGKCKDFDRNKYYLLEWKQDEGCENSDDTALYSQIVCSIAGSYHFYFTHNESTGDNMCGSGYFLVDPIIKYGNNENLPLDCIQCQTVISKQLGSFSTWEDKLKVSKESGYNMIHFTPIQELGASNSAYSLQDQLKLNTSFKKFNGKMPTLEELQTFIEKMRKEWKVTSICDIVLNHTANESPWLHEHPEATYNCQNCTYLRPAYLLDASLNQFSMDVKNGMYESKGIPSLVETEDHLNAIRYHLSEGVLRELKIQELLICDVNKYVSVFLNMARQNQPQNEAKVGVELKIIQDPEYRRLASSVDMDLAMQIYNIYRPDCFDEDARLRKCCEIFKQKLDSLNQEITNRLQDHLNKAVDNVVAGIRYWRVQGDGPKITEITIQNPLIFRYFTDYGTPKNIKECEEIMYSHNSRFLMAHNGWVMDSDPLVNFAGPQSDVYIRRELVAWGDSVKLRFGDKPSDSPFLWDHMRKYVELTARIFDGVRLDNCHSTPIKVAEYLLDCARKVRPDLYVVAELFTNSDATDNIFVNKLGISSLIREALNAWDSHEQGRLVYRFGGVPVGSFYQPNPRPLVPSIAHALFLDLTHDNKSPIETRSVFDLLPSSALVSMACCGVGSNRGYDELVPHQISVVDETREYTEWKVDNIDENPKYVSKETGIIAAKSALNDLHYKLGIQGFNQVYVDQMDPDVVAVTRHSPKTHQSYILVAFTAFKHPGENDYKWQRNIRPLRVEGILDEIVLEASLSHIGISKGDSKYSRSENFATNAKYINGYTDYKVSMKQNIQLNESSTFEKVDSANTTETVLNFKNFKPGSIVVIKVSLLADSSRAVTEVRNLMREFSLIKQTGFSEVVKKLNLSDLNRALYRCDQEERDEGKGFDTYKIPGYGNLVYSGLQGFISLLSKIRPKNDLGHPMCDNLRQGNWMIDYIYQRLKADEGTEELGKWIEENTKSLKVVPSYLKPAYFDMVFTGIYIMLIEHSHRSMSSFVNKGSIFVKALSMGSLQFAAYIKSADLPTLSPKLSPPKPPTRLDENKKEIQACISLSAGLPHFSVGYMRNWGRDTFIALRGLFILTGRYQEARYHILGYAACLRHGLIPNLLDGGRNSRFNCRDAVWWWLYCIKCYVEDVPNGLKILEDKVSRIFPTDDSAAQQAGQADQSLQDVMQEALSRHFQGVTFRERNAGSRIDEHMTDNGFNNQIGVHPETGFVFGGNVDNCGTWMDKMGSSYHAGNKGKPATPRDGSACEIVGLSKCVVSWLSTLYKQKKYKYEGVERIQQSSGKVTKWTFEQWGEKIKENFEKYFWVSEKPVDSEINHNLINKRGIYKDCHGASQEWTDYQLRCNFPIVMVVAPELFYPQHAWTALQQAEKYLLGPLGMKTLDPSDWAYRGDYDNSNDSNDASVAHGFNYHQGPEWVWPIGYFFRAKLYFAARNNRLRETIAEIKYKLSKHFTELQMSDWKGLPELTNSNGSYCRDSSRTQAWSMSSILEVLYDLQKIESSI